MSMKFSWNPATPIHFPFVYGCFCSAAVGLHSCHRDHRACKAKNIYDLAFYRQIC